MTVSMPKLEQETWVFQQNCGIVIEYKYEYQGLYLFLFPQGYVLPFLCGWFFWIIFIGPAMIEAIAVYFYVFGNCNEWINKLVCTCMQGCEYIYFPRV